MRKTYLCAVIAIAPLLGASSATQPATQPADDIFVPAPYPAIAPAPPESPKAEDRFRDAVASSIKNLATTWRFKEANKQVDARFQELKAAREKHDTQAILDSSSAYHEANDLLRALAEKTCQDDPSVIAAENCFYEAMYDDQFTDAEKRDEIAEEKRKQEEWASRGPLQRAIDRHVLAIGMTFEQATEAMGESEKIDETADQVTYEWSRRAASQPAIPDRTYFYDATFVGGRIVHIVSHKS